MRWVRKLLKSKATDSNLRSNIELNSERDTKYAHRDDAFDSVLHIFHLGWHGIRNASGTLPGHKLGIWPDRPPTHSDLAEILAFLEDKKTKHIIFQAYSSEAAELAALLRKKLGENVSIYNVSHVSASQLKYHFEIEMIKVVNEQIESGVINRRASVKPGGADFLSKCDENLIYNCGPFLVHRVPEAESDFIFIPLENLFRKNLYTNLIAAVNSKHQMPIKMINTPSFISDILDISRVEIVPFLNREDMFSTLAGAQVVLNGSFAECQPMIHLESIACGTPCLTGVLGLPVLRDLPLTRLTEVAAPDNSRLMTERLDEVLDIRKNDAQKLRSMISEYEAKALDLSLNSYKQLLDLT